MTTQAEIRRWLSPLLASRSDVIFRERSLWLKPAAHVCRSIFFEGSSDRTDPRPRWYFTLPFTPFGLPPKIWSAQIMVGRSTDTDFAQRVFGEFTDAIDNRLKPISSIEAFYQMTLEDQRIATGAGWWQLSKYPPYHACVLAALGRLGEALRVAEAHTAQIPQWEKALGDAEAISTLGPNGSGTKSAANYARRGLSPLLELQRLVVLARVGDRQGVASLLHEWERRKVRRWEIEDIWESTPFPVELDAGAA